MKEYIVTEHPDFPYEEPKPQELIRCKDCKFATCIEQNEDWWECKHDKRVNHSNGYCNWAERKEE